MLVASTALSSSSLAVNYTWTGANGDGNWNNALNWDANGIPLDDAPGTGNDAGLSTNYMDSITFTGAALPTANIPGWGGRDATSGNGLSSTPPMHFNSGGSINIILDGREGAIWTNAPANRNIMTIGDGIGGGIEDVEVTLDRASASGNLVLSRHGNDVTNNFKVNADGTLTFAKGIDMNNGEGRVARITIDGGTVRVNGVIIDCTNNVNSIVDFTANGGSFTAEFGGDFADFVALTASQGVDFINNSGGALQAVDNLDGSFTVSTVGLTNPNYWTGNGGTTWDETATVNFTTNDKAEALMEDTFANAKALHDKVTFADFYWDNDVATPVTQNLVTIDTDGVGTSLVDFSNKALAYTVDSTDANGIKGGTEVHIRSGGTVTLRGTHSYHGNTLISSGSTLKVGDGAVDGSITNSNVDNNGLLSFTLAGALAQNGLISGQGAVTKAGAGTLTIAQDGSYSGTTTISTGSLRHLGTSRSSNYVISGGAMVEFDFGVDMDMPADTVFQGAGTLKKSGGGTAVWNSPSATFELGPGSLIDVQGGTLTGGSQLNEDWTANRSDLQVASGATFDGVEANVRVDALSGSGTIKSGSSRSSYRTFTFGVDNGSGTFAGSLQNSSKQPRYPANFTKEGSGTQVLTGVNTYGGSTIVKGSGALLINGDHSGATGLITVVQGATLGGHGMLGGPCDVDGFLSPGASIGVFNTLDIVLDGTLVIEVDGTASDRLFVAGSLDLSGTSVLKVSEIGAGATGSAYIIASYTTLTGTFASEIVPPGFEVDYNHQPANQIALVSDGSIADTDGDGIPDPWETAQFGNLGTANATSDFDGDGASDFTENLYGTDPKDAGSQFIMTVAQDSGNMVKVTYGPVKAGRSYSVVATSDLGLYNVLTGSTFVPIRDAPSYTYIDPGDITAEFYRIAVSLTP